MVVAIVKVNRHHGFFMNLFGNKQGEGYEYHLLALGLAIALIIGGAGAWSLDAVIARRGRRIHDSAREDFLSCCRSTRLLE